MLVTPQREDLRRYMQSEVHRSPQALRKGAARGQRSGHGAQHGGPLRASISGDGLGGLRARVS